MSRFMSGRDRVDANGHCELPAGMTHVPDRYFYNFDGTGEGCKALKSLNVPSSVVSIGERAFYSCSSLRFVSIPTSVTRIGERAFALCSLLDAVSFCSPSRAPSRPSLTQIETYAFRHSPLASVIVPSTALLAPLAFHPDTSVTRRRPERMVTAAKVRGLARLRRCAAAGVGYSGFSLCPGSLPLPSLSRRHRIGGADSASTRALLAT